MLRRLFLAFVALCLLMCVPVLAEEPEKHRCGDFEYVILEDGTAEITFYYGNEIELTLPSELDGINVTSVKDLGWSAHLLRVIIPDTITVFDSSAVIACLKLSSISVSLDHPTLAVIDGVLFSKEDKRLICYPRGKNGSEYTISAGIQTIDESAFYSCELERIIIPDSVTGIGPRSIVDCNKLKEIKVSPDNPIFADIDGVLFSKKDKRLISYPSGKSNTEYSVPNGIQIIGEYAFENNSTLKSIRLPGSVIMLSEYAFTGCKSLADISIPDTVASIGNSVFRYCEGLKEISLPESITSIGSCAFIGCSGLEKIILPKKVVSIGNFAFWDCTGIKEITLPESITSVGFCPFRGCSNLVVTISDDHPALEMIDGVLINKQDKSLIWYPPEKEGTAYEIPQGIQTIGGYAFSDSKLETILIPDSVKEIEEGAFGNCKSLHDITIPGSVDNIGDQAFLWCTDLRSVIIDEGVKSIGEAAFASCWYLSEITIPDSVSFIGLDAFNTYGKLTLTVTRDSYAAEYCKENQLNYTYPDVLDWLNN